jgi:hypothetical protein
VEARLGQALFVTQTSQAQRLVDVRVARQGARWHATLTVRDAAGTPLGVPRGGERWLLRAARRVVLVVSLLITHAAAPPHAGATSGRSRSQATAALLEADAWSLELLATLWLPELPPGLRTVRVNGASAALALCLPLLTSGRVTLEGWAAGQGGVAWAQGLGFQQSYLQALATADAGLIGRVRLQLPLGLRAELGLGQWIRVLRPAFVWRHEAAHACSEPSGVFIQHGKKCGAQAIEKACR